MGRKLLAGPFPIVDVNGNWKANMNVWFTCWWKNVGLLSQFNNSIDPVTGAAVITGQDSGLITLDGLYQDSTGLGGNMSWDTVNDTFRNGSAGVPYQPTPRGFAAIPLQPGMNPPYNWYPAGNTVLLQDREIQAVDWFGGTLIRSFHYNGNDSGSPLAQPFLGGYVEANIWAGGNPAVALGHGNGELVIYDYNTEGGTGGTRFAFYDIAAKKLNSPIMNLGMTCLKLLFLPEFGVVLSLHTTPGGVGGTPYLMRFWSLKALPANVSTPVLIAGQVGPGQVATYQVTVTGAQGDVADNQLVDWSLSGVGTLVSPQSMTDINGNATCQVVYDPATTVGNTSTVTASVTF